MLKTSDGFVFCPSRDEILLRVSAGDILPVENLPVPGTCMRCGLVAGASLTSSFHSTENVVINASSPAIEHSGSGLGAVGISTSSSSVLEGGYIYKYVGIVFTVLVGYIPYSVLLFFLRGGQKFHEIMNHQLYYRKFWRLNFCSKQVLTCET